jgi:hypothetical protein
MIQDIHEILCTIVKLYAMPENQGVLPTNLLYDIAKFTEYGILFNLLFSTVVQLIHDARTLQKVFTFLKEQQRMGKIKQLFKKAENGARLEICKEELNYTQKKFKVSYICFFRIHIQVVTESSHWFYNCSNRQNAKGCEAATRGACCSPSCLSRPYNFG